MQKGSFSGYEILFGLVILLIYACISLWKTCRKAFPKFDNWCKACTQSKIFKASTTFIGTAIVVAVLAFVVITGTVLVFFIPIMFFVF